MMTKILTICQRGNVRSVTLASILKDLCGLKDVAPIGIETTTPDGIAGLMAWADCAYVAGTVAGSAEFQLAYPDRVTILERIGRDVYGRAMHPVLVDKCIDALKDTDLLNGHYPYFGTIENYIQANRIAFGQIA